MKHHATRLLAAVVALQAAAVLSLAPLEVLGARRLPTDQELGQLQARLNYTFADPWILRQALIHPSFGELNNARLSWLGDAIMGAAVADLVFQARPSASNQELHEARMALVQRQACAHFATKLGLDKLLVVGAGYEGEAPTPHMLAEGFEAVWGAIYVDGGLRMDKVKELYNASFPVH